MNMPKTQLSTIKFLELAGFNREEIAMLASDGKEAASSEQKNKNKSLVHLLPAAASLRKDASTALQLGQINTVPYLGFFGYALQSCADLRQVLNLLLRYHPLIVGHNIHWEFHPIEESIAIRFIMTIGSPEQNRLMAELAFANFFSVAKHLTGETCTAIEVQFKHSKPEYYNVYKKHLPAPISFDSPYNQILISNGLLDLPIKTANPADHIVFQQQCEEMLRDINRIENTSAAVRRLLIQSAGNFPNIDQAAQHLHMSTSTLGRRLKSESSSFRTITDEIKNLLAKEYLMRTELTVADIAHLLDYTDTANFRRAFVRWNNVPPNEYRA